MFFFKIKTTVYNMHTLWRWCACMQPILSSYQLCKFINKISPIQFSILFFIQSISLYFINSIAESYRKSFIDVAGGEAMQAHKLFCSWDFGISNEKAAEMKRHSIYMELKSIITQLYEFDYHRTWLQKIGGVLISILVWIFIAGILITIGYSVTKSDLLKVPIS